VRNITDVGHLLDDGEDRIAKGARLDKLEPMEVVQKYTNGFHDMMSIFNTIPPSIEPHATGHIIEQIQMVQDILDNGWGYEVNGSVYFDVQKFDSANEGVYGMLSGRKLEDLLSETRDNLKNQSEKRNPTDFAIWMKASPEHIMRWPSPWSDGFPGWHLECSAMSTKYLGKEFDIHGGGGDLKFPHHENEIAQNVGACGCSPAKYWLHANMLLMNGRKMSKSDGNTIDPPQLFSGESEHISKAYAPMAVKFFMLQSHYRSTLDLTDAALLAAEKGFNRLMEGYAAIDEVSGSAGTTTDIDKEILDALEGMDTDMCDDFNAPKAIGRMFEIIPKINGLKDGHIKANLISQSTIEKVKEVFSAYIFDVFGLKDESAEGDSGKNIIGGLMELVLEMRADARTNKDWGTSDKIRDTLNELQIKVKDGKEGTSWTI
jgi:cysteinyl-tRNA synthetase